jgi:hypothetical protein
MGKFDNVTLVVFLTGVFTLLFATIKHNSGPMA